MGRRIACVSLTCSFHSLKLITQPSALDWSALAMASERKGCDRSRGREEVWWEGPVDRALASCGGRNVTPPSIVS